MKLGSSLIVAGVIVGFVSSCATIKPLYQGERRAREEVAVLKLDETGAITNINGTDLQGRAFELLPGRYSVQFRVYFRGEKILEGAKGQRYRRNCVIEFEAQAGHSYVISESDAKFSTGKRKEAGATMRGFNVWVYFVTLDPRGDAIQSTRATCSW